MKIRNYEKKNWIFYSSILMIIIELLLLVYIKEKKEFQYEKITGYSLNSNEILVTPNNIVRKYLYQNKKIFIKDHYVSYEIIDDKKSTLGNNSKKYEIILKIKTSVDTNKIIEMSIKKEKENILSIFKSVWKGESS